MCTVLVDIAKYIIAEDNMGKVRCDVIIRITSNLNERTNIVSICTSVKVVYDYYK